MEFLSYLFLFSFIGVKNHNLIHRSGRCPLYLFGVNGAEWIKSSSLMRREERKYFLNASTNNG